MEGVLAVLAVLGIIIVAFIIFVVYFIFKILQFVIMAINLYKKMVNRQDATIKLLLDIRDNTKKYDTSSSSSSISASDSSPEEDTFICENCKAEVPSSVKKCSNCGAEFE